MRHLSIDIETFSSVDIRKAGLYKYVQSPDFQILLFAYAWEDGPVQIVDLAQGEELPPEIISAFTDPSVTKHAYNAPFEWYCLNKFWPTPLNQWRCTMVHGLYCGYTAGLAATAIALDLPKSHHKASTGTALIRTFCVPCKPTKTNGGRTRNLPHHEPEKWELFKDYCKQDVMVEREIKRRLSGFSVPGQEYNLWLLDQQINANGVAVDRDFVRGALFCDGVVGDELLTEALDITGLGNPNSVAQLKAWVEGETGQEVPDLTKATVAELVESTTGDVKRALEIRQELSKTSVKKYQATDEAVCDDGRIRGLLQFYGANRTGRWAGRLVQVQNLPRNYLKTLAHARECVKARKVDALKLIYGNVPDTLSQLVRTAFVPSPGNTLMVADFSAIEARIIAWLAGEQWRLDVFASHGKIYEASASAMFGVPLEKIVKGNPEYELRQKGKIAELACIAEGQQVFTDKGLVPIEDVRLDHKLWDGNEFVTHQGVIYQGVKEVISYEGLTATPDHLVWVKGQSEPIQFGFAASSGARLVRTGDSGKTIWLGEGYQPRKTLEKRLERLPGINAMCGLRGNSMDAAREFNSGGLKRLPTMFTAPADTIVAGSKINSSKAEMYKPKRRQLCQLRSARNRISFQLGFRCGIMDNGKFGTIEQEIGVGSDRYRRTLRTWEYPVCATGKESSKQAFDRVAGMGSNGMALCPKCYYKKTVNGDVQERHYTGSQICGKREAQKLADDKEKARVYDIIRSGPRNRFTVSGVLVHNCGYQGSVGALKAMGADKMGLSDEELQQIIHRWRSSNKRIVDLWYSMERAALAVMRTGQPAGIKGLIMAREGDYEHRQDFFTITLPSGRKLFYPRPFLSQNDFGKEALHYHGVNQNNKKWEVISTYGGKLVENCVQAIARDCLAEALMRVSAAGYQIVMHVHDEVVLDVPREQADLDRVCEIMGQPIDWAPGLLLTADGFVTDFYMKD